MVKFFFLESRKSSNPENPDSDYIPFIFSLQKNMTEYFLIYQKWKQLNVASSEGTEASMLRNKKTLDQLIPARQRYTH